MDADNATQDAAREQMPQTCANASEGEIASPAPVVKRGSHLQPMTTKHTPGGGKVRPLNCPKHGKRYPIEGSPMCGHPNCLKGWVATCGKRWPFIQRHMKMLEKLSILDDFCQHMIMQFIMQHRAGKGPMMRPQWIAYELRDFARARHNLPRQYTEDSWQNVQEYSDDVRQSVGVAKLETAIVNHLYAIGGTVPASPFQRIQVQQVQRFMVENGDDLQLLLLRGDVTVKDVWRMQMEREREYQERADQRAREKKRKIEPVRYYPAIADLPMQAEMAARSVAVWAHTVADEVYDDGLRELQFPSEGARMVYND